MVLPSAVTAAALVTARPESPPVQSSLSFCAPAFSVRTAIGPGLVQRLPSKTQILKKKESRGCLGGGAWRLHGLRSLRWDFISQRTGETGGGPSSGYSEKGKESLTEPLTTTETFQPTCYSISAMLITPPKYLSSLIPQPRFHHLLPYLLLQSAEV